MNTTRRLKSYGTVTIVFLTVFSMIFLVKVTGSAEEKVHTEQAPHNGQILDTGEKHVEFLIKEGKEVFVYLYDKNLKPISAEGIGGIVYFKLADNNKKESKLIVVKEGDTSYLKGSVDFGTEDYTEAVVSLKMGEKRENLRFGHPAGHEH